MSNKEKKKPKATAVRILSQEEIDGLVGSVATDGQEENNSVTLALVEYDFD